MSPANVLFDVFWLKLVLSVDSYLVPKMVLFRVLEKNIDPRVWCLRGLYPNLSRIIFLGPRFCRNKCPIPKKGHNPQAYMVHNKKYLESILGPWGQTSLDKVPVAKVLFIPLQVSNKLRSEKLHTFPLVATPVSLNIFPWDNPPELWKYQSWGWINFLEGSFFRAQGQEKNPASTNPVHIVWSDLNISTRA